MRKQMGYTPVKLFMFKDLPNEAIFKLGLATIWKYALEETAYEYKVGFFTHDDFEYGPDGVEGEDDFKEFKELNDFFINTGCEVNENIYIKW